MTLKNPDLEDDDIDISLQVDVQFAVDVEDHVSEEQLISWANAAYVHALNNNTELATDGVQECVIRIVDDAESETLNNEFRSKGKPTNVLSFCYEDIDEYLGDIVICLPVVIEEASEQEKSVQDHLAHMVSHGVLHLLGYDHIEPDEAEVMEGLESNILKQLEIANPYSEDLS
jgi:probable rRNA maturation factor